ncbi:MAG: IS21 family transposase [Lentisphaeria bacterium]
MNRLDPVAVRELQTQGLSVRAIARRLGVHRRSVRQALAQAAGQPPASRPGRPRPSLLDPHRVYIATLLERHPDLPARRVWSLLRSERGFTGGVTIVRQCVNQLRPHQPQAYFTLAFAPGECAQADWGVWERLDVEGTPRRLSFFVMVLAHSRMLYAELALAEAMEHWLACHRHAFEFFGGVPQKVRVDRCKTAVTGLDPFGRPLVTADYAALARHYGFTVDPCAAYCPNQKGRVESGVGYLRTAFFAGRQPCALPALAAALRDWLTNEANVRMHGATGRRPADVFAAEERNRLRSLPPVPHPACVTKQTVADSRFRVTVETNRYSVPCRYASRHLVLERHADRIVLRDPADGRAVADHPRSYGRKQDIVDPVHEQGLVLRTRHAADRRLLEDFLALGPAAAPYLAGLQERRPDWRSHLRRICALAGVHGRDDTARVLADALEHRAFGADYVLNILNVRARGLPEPGPLHVTRRQDLLELSVPEPDFQLYDPPARNPEEPQP